MPGCGWVAGASMVGSLVRYCLMKHHCVHSKCSRPDQKPHDPSAFLTIRLTDWSTVRISPRDGHLEIIDNMKGRASPIHWSEDLVDLALSSFSRSTKLRGTLLPRSSQVLCSACAKFSRLNIPTARKPRSSRSQSKTSHHSSSGSFPPSSFAAR